MPPPTVKIHSSHKKLLEELQIKYNTLQSSFDVISHENEALKRQIELQDATLKLTQRERESPSAAMRHRRDNTASSSSLGFDSLLNSKDEFEDYFREESGKRRRVKSSIAIGSPTEAPMYLSLNTPISSVNMLRKMSKTRDYGNLLPIANVRETVCNYMFDLFVQGEQYRGILEEERSSLGDLYKFRSLQQKTQLLDDALGNAVLNLDGEGSGTLSSGSRLCPDYSSTIIILLHLKESLSPDLFLRCILAPRPAAQDIYLTYLHRTNATKEAENLYRVLGRIYEYGMILVERALRSSHPGSITQKELDALDRAIELCSKYSELEFEATQLIQRKNLLQRELKVTESQLASPKSSSSSSSFTNVIDASSPANHIPRPSVANVSVRDFVHYCLLFHAKAPPGRASSPLAAKKYFGMSEKQYTYLQLLTVAQKEQWHEVQDLLPLSGLITKKPNSPLNLYTYLYLCHEHHAPEEIMEYFMSFVQPDKLRLDIAKRFHLFELCIALCIKMKFREELQHIQAYIKQQSRLSVTRKEQLDRQIEDALRDPKTRWVAGGKGTQKEYDTRTLFS